jgi:hypothetical protein
MAVPTIPVSPTYILRNATVARTLLGQPQTYPGAGETVRLDIAVERGRIARIAATGSIAGGTPIDLEGGML